MSRRWVIALVLVLGAITGLFLRFRSSTDQDSSSNPAASSAQDDRREGTPAYDPIPAIEPSSETGAPEREVLAAGARPIVLAGVVLDYAAGAGNPGTPAPGVSVRARLGFIGEVALDPVAADEDGRFRVELPDPGQRPLHFTLSTQGRDALRGAHSKVVLGDGDLEELAIRLERFPKGDLAGVTVDCGDRPVPEVRLVLRMGEATREVVSDADGRFRLPNADWFDGLEAEREGYVLLRAAKPKDLPTGGFEPMTVVLAPVARLHVRVVDSERRPLEGFRVSPSISPWEKEGEKRVDFDFRPQLRQVTGRDGRASFERIWAGQKLAIGVGPAKAGIDSGRKSEREWDGELIFGATSGGSPITLAAGESRELIAVVSALLRIRGRVVAETGEPAPEAHVALATDRRVAGEEESLRVETTTDAEGQFSFEIVVDKPPSAARVTASDDLLGGRFDAKARIASAIVDLGSEPSELVLVLRHSLTIGGRILGKEGEGVRGRVSAYGRSGDELDRFETFPREGIVSKDGSFLVKGLGPGTYDLLAQPSERYAETWMRGVEAGQQRIEIRLGRERPARVHVEVHLREGEPGQIILLTGRLRPRDTFSNPPEELARTAEHSLLEGWPPAVAGMWYGSGSFVDERGVATCHSFPVKENPKELVLDEGLWWLGAKGRDAEGNLLFPIGTGLVRIEAGEYRVRFELTTAVPVHGRVSGGDVLNLSVGIARSDGDLLELDVGSRTLRTSRPLGADGSFEFTGVPVGKHELWVGTATELAGGVPVRRVPLAVDRKGVPFLEVLLGQ